MNHRIKNLYRILKRSGLEEQASDLEGLSAESESIMERLSPGDIHAVREQLRKLSAEELAKLQKELNEADDKLWAQYSGMMSLYHGAPDSVAKKIREQGFQLTKGQRTSGFMGAGYAVDNQAIFLTQNKDMAKAFGKNRADVESAEVLEVFADIKNPLDMTAWNKVPKELRSIGEDLVKKYSGGKPNQSDMFWLLDQPQFVAAIKERGYDSVMFKESASTLHGMGLGRKGEITVAVFDPSRLYLAPPPKGSLHSLLLHLNKK